MSNALNSDTNKPSLKSHDDPENVFDKITRLIRKGKDGKVIEILSDISIDLNGYDKLGNTPSAVAAFNGRIEVLQYLYDRGADIFKKNRNVGEVMTCFGSRHKVIFDFIVDKDGFNANEICEGGFTPVQNCLQNLVQYGFFGNIEEVRLHLVPEKIEVLRKLVSLGADINHQNSHGRTALMSACLVGSIELVEALVELGADPNFTDAKGGTAIDYALSEEMHTAYAEIFSKVAERPSAAIESAGGTDAPVCH